MLAAQAMATKLAPLGLRMKEIKADGHCMYRSLEHQLQADAAASSRPSFLQLRAAAAEYMRAHPDTFSPFIEVGSGILHVTPHLPWGLRLLRRRL
jgi:OTU domain-containing protein 6